MSRLWDVQGAKVKGYCLLLLLRVLNVQRLCEMMWDRRSTCVYLPVSVFGNMWMPYMLSVVSVIFRSTGMFNRNSTTTSSLIYKPNVGDVLRSLHGFN